jgi:DNA-binding LytR/AlgR family response regulator
VLGVFICEDNEVQRKQVTSFIRKYLLIEELDMAIKVSTGDPEEILDYLEQHPDSRGIYFLDVDLKCEMNGIELGAIVVADIQIQSRSDGLYFKRGRHCGRQRTNPGSLRPSAATFFGGVSKSG